MVMRVTEQRTGLVYRKFGLATRAGFVSGALLALAGACSVDSRVGYTFGKGGSAGTGNTANGGTASGGRATSSGGSKASGGAHSGEAGAAGDNNGGSAGELARGGSTSSGGTGEGRGGESASGGTGSLEGGSGGEAGSTSGCTLNSCPGAFSCDAGVCNESCVDDNQCVAGAFCGAGSCHYKAVQVAVGGGHSCVLLSDGSVRCWGSNSSMELGAGTTAPRSAQPVLVSGVTDATQIAAQDGHTCALLANGKVVCWGSNFYGALGNSSVTLQKSAQPVTVELPSAARAISGTCAALKSGGVYCWGPNIYGELADPSLGTHSAKPVPIAGIPEATAVTPGPCAIVHGTIHCWGNNNDGQCGSGTGPSALTIPAPVNGLSAGTAIAVSGSNYAHACGLVTGGAMFCWGSNDDGRLGTGSIPDQRTWSALGVKDMSSNVHNISAGRFHTCAVLASGAAYCWGRGVNGEVGDGASTSRDTPVAVTGLDDAIGIAAGGDHTCAIRKNGAAVCWGYGEDGQLGTLWTSSASPVAVPYW
ncbi:MAG: RCC1 domain-containing protein [Myxococcota bacterium]